MALNLNSFRINAATAARSAVVAGLVLGGLMSTARAETGKPATVNGGVTTTTDCSKYRPDMVVGDTLCAYYKDKAATERGKALDKDIKDQLRLNACFAQLLSFKKDKPDEFTKLGEITRKNACDIAARLPQKSAALDLR